MTRSVIVQRQLRDDNERIETDHDSSLAFNFIEKQIKRTDLNLEGGENTNNSVLVNRQSQQPPNYQRPLRKNSALP